MAAPKAKQDCPGQSIRRSEKCTENGQDFHPEQQQGERQSPPSHDPHRCSLSPRSERQGHAANHPWQTPLKTHFRDGNEDRINEKKTGEVLL